MVVSSDKELYAARPTEKGIIFARSDGPPGSPSELIYFDLQTQREEVLAKSQVKQGQVDWPTANDDWVVWVDFSQPTGEWIIYAMDRKTREQTVVASSDEPGSYRSTVDFPSPELSGDIIVWEDGIDPINTKQADIFMHDLRSGKRKRLTETGGAQAPRIVGDRVIYHQRTPDNNFYLWLLDLKTRESRQLTTVRSAVEGFDGRYIAYNQMFIHPDGNQMILKVLDLETGVEREIAPKTPNGQHYSAAIGGGFVVWSGVGDQSFYVLDLNQPDQPARLVPKGLRPYGTFRQPQALGDQVVWIGSDGTLRDNDRRDMIFHAKLP